MNINRNNLKRFEPQQGLKGARTTENLKLQSVLESGEKRYVWTSGLERVGIIREGVPYTSLEVISRRMNTPVKDVLNIFSLPQTTYNKKKKEKSLLSSRDSETVLLLIELIDLGLEVFNQEEAKFLRWMKKPNVSLGGATPDSLLDSATGIHEVTNCLNRLEYGNLA